MRGANTFGLVLAGAVYGLAALSLRRLTGGGEAKPEAPPDLVGVQRAHSTSGRPKSSIRYSLDARFFSLPIFRPLSACKYSLATSTGIGFLPCARSLARPAGVEDMPANPCWACDV